MLRTLLLGCVVFVGCGGGGGTADLAMMPPPPDMSLDKFTGTWKYSNGTQTATCNGQPQVTPITGNLTIAVGVSSDLVTTDPNCNLKWSAGGATSSLLPGQSCTGNFSDGMGCSWDWTMNLVTGTLVTSDGMVMSQSEMGNIVYRCNGGAPLTCSIVVSATLMKVAK